MTVSLILKCITAVAAAVGVYLSASAGLVAFMGGSRVFMYFTIQSNIAVALVCAVGTVMILKKTSVGNGWLVLKFVLMLSITLTGAVFVFVLAPTLGDLAWNPQNVLTHVVVPIASVADLFVTGIYGDIGNRHILLVPLPPIAYLIYAAVGYAAGWEFADGVHYPYFFLNWGGPAGAFGFIDRFPFMGCVWWILAGLGVLMAVALVYVRILDLLRRRYHRRNTV